MRIVRCRKTCKCGNCNSDIEPGDCYIKPHLTKNPAQNAKELGSLIGLVGEKNLKLCRDCVFPKSDIAVKIPNVSGYGKVTIKTIETLDDIAGLKGDEGAKE